MEEVIDLELRFRKGDFFATELILQLDQFVLKLDAPFTLVVQISLEAILGLPKLLSLILEHELHLAKPSVIVVAV
jgi:hypothetical protein